MKIKSQIKAGASINHNEKQVASAGLKIKSQIKAGGTLNHNEKQVRVR